MIREEKVISGITIAAIRFFLGPESDGPYYEVFMDMDTETITYVEPAISATGRIVMPCFSVWSSESPRTLLATDLAQRGRDTSPDAHALIEAILTCPVGRY